MYSEEKTSIIEWKDLNNTLKFNAIQNSVLKESDSLFLQDFKPDLTFRLNYDRNNQMERQVFVSQKQNSDSNVNQFKRTYISVVFTKGSDGTPRKIDNNIIFNDTSVVNNSLGDRLVIGVVGTLVYQKNMSAYMLFFQNDNIIEYCIQNITNRLDYSLDRPVSH